MVQFGDQKLVALGCRLCHVYKQRLIGRAGKGAKQVEEVLLAGRTGGDERFGALEV